MNLNYNYSGEIMNEYIPYENTKTYSPSYSSRNLLVVSKIDTSQDWKLIDSATPYFVYEFLMFRSYNNDTYFSTSGTNRGVNTAGMHHININANNPSKFIDINTIN